MKVAQRGFAHRALEQKHPVGQVHRVTVAEVDLHLAGTGLVDQRLNPQPVHAAKAGELHEKRVKVVHRINRIRLAPGLRLAGAPQRRLQWFVRVVLPRHQIELHLGRHHRPPALFFIKRHHMAQHTAWCQLHQRAVVLMAVVNHHRHRLGRPGHQPHGGRIGQADHVGVGLAHIGAVVGLLAVHRIEQHTLGQAHFAGLQKQVFGQNLAACDAGHVGDDTLHLVDAVFRQKRGNGVVHAGFLLKFEADDKCCGCGQPAWVSP